MKLGLGAVQFGLDYGLDQGTGPVPVSSVTEILSAAQQMGIELIDTARSYGVSETVLGREPGALAPFNLVTKLPALNKKQITAQDIQKLEADFATSLDELHLPSVTSLLLHQGNDLLTSGADALYGLLTRLKQEGRIKKLGVSVYGTDELLAIIERYPIDCVQLPLNVFDQRFLRTGTLQQLKSRGVEIHVRSLFLQGLLLFDSKQLPEQFQAYVPLFKQYNEWVKNQGLSLLDAAMAFIKQIEEVDVVLVGVKSLAQLKANHASFTKPLAAHYDFSEFSCEDATLVDPRSWQTALV